MALYGLLADIHGNREALAAVLDQMQRRQVNHIACLGDIVGYNADPDECVALVRARCSVAIAGNHDLIGVGQLDLHGCSNKTRYSLKRTRKTLAPASTAYLAALPPHQVLEPGVVLVHGGVRDLQQYMVTPSLIRENARLLEEDFPGARLCFFGHSHEQKVYRVDGDSVRELAGQRYALERENIYFVNPGSVDASRKGGPKFAQCALFDSARWTVEFLRVRYDCAATEAKAAAFGYRITPLIDRLYSLQRRLVRLPRRLGWAG
jgi:predicted phosphodiesterase